MAKHVGVGWASNGWFGVVLTEDGGWETDLFPSIWSLWKYHSDASSVFVDIPIGLPSDERRACDVRAREMVHRRRGVFYAPVRSAVYQQNLEEAKAANEAAAGFSVQNHVWRLVPRIREVDEFLDMFPSARDRLIETRPEVCFHALNGRNALEASATTESGVRRRRALLADEHPAAVDIYEQAVDRYLTPAYAPTVGSASDILDALVAAVTARRTQDERLSLPDAPPTDERGLPMRVVYPSDTEQVRLSTLESYE